LLGLLLVELGLLLLGGVTVDEPVEVDGGLVGYWISSGIITIGAIIIAYTPILCSIIVPTILPHQPPLILPDSPLHLFIIPLRGFHQKIININPLQIPHHPALIHLHKLLIPLGVVVDVLGLDLVDETGDLKQLVLAGQLLGGFLWGEAGGGDGAWDRLVGEEFVVVIGVVVTVIVTVDIDLFLPLISFIIPRLSRHVHLEPLQLNPLTVTTILPLLSTILHLLQVQPRRDRVHLLLVLLCETFGGAVEFHLGFLLCYRNGVVID